MHPRQQFANVHHLDDPSLHDRIPAPDRQAERKNLLVTTQGAMAPGMAEAGPEAIQGVYRAVIVVEKLTKNVNENHLREIFGAYGSIKELDLPMNKQCKPLRAPANKLVELPLTFVDLVMTNRGTAYILYTNTTDAEAAIAHMHEAQLDGAIIHVSIVLPRRKFSRSPPPARRGGPPPPPFDRYDNRGPPPPGAYRGGPPPGSGYGGPPPPSGRYRSPPPPPRRGSPGRGYGRRPDFRHPRDRNGDVYRPRSYSRSRSRSRSYSSRSRSPTPPRRGGGRGYRNRESPPGGGRRRRSPSYSSYSSYSDRSRSRDRARGRYGRDR
ncbi:MAG: hypothetical protein LQ339_004613 [Xanthoria mediterranea]|nr:MAG: hypothetical protein LQ339_004613 [Xanthoria mediterranea]